jgi:hypothetical protein
MESIGNPIQLLDVKGKVFTDLSKKLSKQPTHIVHYDTRDRNTTAYPLAENVAILLPRVFNNVYAIELAEAIIPVAANTEPYFFVCCPQAALFEGAKDAHNKTANPTVNNALAKIQNTPDSSVIYYEMSGSKPFRKIFPSFISKLDRLEISLRTYNGGYWALGANEASFTFHIYCAN